MRDREAERERQRDTEGQSQRQVGGIPGLLLVLHDQIPANLTHQGYREIIMYK